MSDRLKEDLAAIFAALGEFRDADALMSDVFGLGLQVDRASSWMNRMTLYQQRRDVEGADEAKVWHQRALECARVAESLLLLELAEHNNPQSLQDLASVKVAVEDWAGAVSRLREALEKCPASAEVELRSNLAIAYAGQDAYGDAVLELRRVLSIDPERIEDRIRLARVLLAMKAPERAEDELRAVLATAPQNISAGLALGDVLLAKGEGGDGESFTEADAVLGDTLALSFAAEQAAYGARKASTVLVGKSLSDALYLQGYAKVKQPDASWRGRIRAGASSARLDAAEALFQRAIEADRRNVRASRALTLLRSGRKQERTAAGIERFGAPVVALVAVVALVLVQLSLFISWPALRRERESLTFASYGALTFGLLALLMAAFYLPSILKLKVAGVELEKSVQQPSVETPIIGISRDSRPASLTPVVVPTMREELGKTNAHVGSRIPGSMFAKAPTARSAAEDLGHVPAGDDR